MLLADLQIPAKAEFVSVARLVVASVADDRYELTNDRLDNLKLAVSEACALAIEYHQQGEAAIGISCRAGKKGFDVLLHSAGNEFARTRLPSESLEVEGKSLEGELGMPFIESLVDELALETNQGSGVLRLSLHCEPAEEL